MLQNTDTTKLQKLQTSSFSIENGVKLFDSGMVYADSHQGLVRSDNQDSFAYTVSSDGKMIFLMVADGIGGNEAGDIASRYTAEMILREFQKFQKNGTPQEEEIVDFLKSTILLANSALKNLNINMNVGHPMGTTLAILVLTPGCAVTAHAGDSRIYRWREGKLEQMTQDHSLVAELVKLGKLTPEQAVNHPYAHVISQSIGVHRDVKPDFSIQERKSGDRYMVCSDGILLHLEDEKIAELIGKAEDARAAVSSLITAALRGGGGDNTTVLCAIPD